METLNTAPATLLDGQRDDVLRITATNLGTAGPADLEWASLGLLIESAPGTPLAAGLLSAVEVYADTNLSGAYEPAADALVAVVLAPAPAADGTLSITFESSDPAGVRVPAGQSRTWFLVAALPPGASAKTPPTLRITHLVNGPAASFARNTANGLLLTMQPAPDVASSTITALPNTAPTTSGIADVTSFEPAQPGSVPLFAAFHDAEDAPAQLTYSITGITNPAIFSFVGLDLPKGALALNYAPGVAGSSFITVRATDRGGLTVATSFKVSVALIQTYADWAAFHAASGSQQQDAAGLSNLVKYAFALDPRSGGDIAGLPRLVRSGNARVFSHLRPKHATDLTYRYEYSTDLAGWQPAINGQQFYQNTTDLGDGRTRVELLLLISGPKVFLRALADHAAGGAASGFLAGGDPLNPGGDPPPADITPPPGTHPIRGTVVFPQQNVVNANALAVSGVDIGDLDGDGLRDLISVSAGDDKIAWYRNLGGGTFGAAQVLTTSVIDPFCVELVDFDGDGKLDIYVGARGFSTQPQLVWFRGLGGGAFTGPQTIASGDYSTLYVGSIATADIDGDGRRDAISSSISFTGPENDRIAWYRNLGNGSFGPQQLISNAASAPWCAAAGDINGDGKVDIVSASSKDDKVAWYAGNGDGTFGPQQVISLANDNVRSVSLADLDRDGLLDVVSVASITNTIDNIIYSRVACYRNLGGGAFSEQVISSTTVGAAAATLADLNGDGYPEVIVASAMAANGVGNRVVWFENLGGSFGPENIVSTAVSGALAVAAGDINGDGTIDVASASQNDNKVAWYRNLGGQFSLATTSTAPASLHEGARAAVLRVSLTNHGQPGDDNARLKTLALLIESAPGVPFGTAEANALIDRLDVFADTNGTGVFEPATDKLLHTALYLPLTAGRVTLAFNGLHDPAWQVPPGGMRHFFVVPRLTQNAAAQSLISFRFTHLTAGTPRTTGQDAQTGAPLVLEPVASFTGSFITAQVNHAPTAGGIPAIIVGDTVAPTSVALWNYFGDTEDGAAGLHYEIVGNTNPAMFQFTGIAPTTGVLLLKYQPGAGGTAQITVRATDSLGKSATASLSVHVQVASSMSAWLALNFPGGVPGALPFSPLMSYAFALDPRLAGDTRGLPRIRSVGKARILSHLRPRYAADLQCDYEISTNMVTWTPAIHGFDYYQFVNNLPDALQQVDVVILANGPRVFLRARPQLAP